MYKKIVCISYFVARHCGVRSVIRIGSSARRNPFSPRPSSARTVKGRHFLCDFYSRVTTPGVRIRAIFFSGFTTRCESHCPLSRTGNADARRTPGCLGPKISILAAEESGGPRYKSGRRGTATVEFYLQGALIPRRSRLRFVGLLLLLLPLLPIVT